MLGWGIISNLFEQWSVGSRGPGRGQASPLHFDEIATGFDIICPIKGWLDSSPNSALYHCPKGVMGRVLRCGIVYTRLLIPGSNGFHVLCFIHPHTTPSS